MIGRRSLGSVLLLGVGAAAMLAVGRVAAGAPGGPDGPAALVNPMIGTASYSHKSADNGDTFPGPDMPFGMIQWSPDAFPARAYGGGYDYDAQPDPRLQPQPPQRRGLRLGRRRPDPPAGRPDPGRPAAGDGALLARRRDRPGRLLPGHHQPRPPRRTAR